MTFRIGYQNYVNGGPRNLASTLTGSYLHDNSTITDLGNRRVGLRARFKPSWYLHNVSGATVVKNNVISFDEGGGPITTSGMTVGAYDGDGLAAEIKSKMDAAGGQTYSVSWDPILGLFTISAAAGFDLLTNSGNAAFVDLCAYIGFDTSANTGTATSHTSDNIIQHMGHSLIINAGSNITVDTLAIYKPRSIQLSGHNTTPTVENTDFRATVYSHSSDLGMDYRAWADSGTYEFTTGDIDVSALSDVNQLITYVNSSASSSAQFFLIWFHEDSSGSPVLMTNNWLELGYVFLGTGTKIDGGTGCTPSPAMNRTLEIDDRGLAVMTQGGQSFGANVPKRYIETVTFQNMAAADWDLLADAAEVIGSTESALFVFDDTASNLNDGRSAWFGRWINAATFARRNVNDTADCTVKVRQSQD